MDRDLNEALEHIRTLVKAASESDDIEVVRKHLANKCPRAFVVAYKPFSLVPNNQTWKRLRQGLLITTNPSSPAYQDTFVVLGRGRDRLPTTTHSL